MIGILNRWRQFGRRYFWPHLLLGMVTASLGISFTSPSVADQAALPSTTSSLNRQNSNNTAFNSLVLLQSAPHRAVFSVDYWHQHAIRTVIRHLSFALTTPQMMYAVDAEMYSTAHAQPLKIQCHALLTSLNALLTHELKTPVSTHDTPPHTPLLLAAHQPGLWLAQTGGIRAGPL